LATSESLAPVPGAVQYAETALGADGGTVAASDVNDSAPLAGLEPPGLVLTTVIE
jgi:hypothetical protein